MSDRQRLILERYEALTATELGTVLCDDLKADGNRELDAETLLCVMQLYAQKQTDKPLKTAQEAYAEFCRDYMPQSASEHSSKIHRHKTRWWRYMTTAAAVVTLIMCAGLGVRGWVVKGGQLVYRQDHGILLVQGAYREGTKGHVRRIAEESFPQWIPEGYECAQTDWDSDTYNTVYYRGDPAQGDCLSICYQAVTLGSAMRFYKDPEQAKVITHDGTKFYLYTNGPVTGAVGSFGGMVVSVNGKLSDEEMIRLVKSMHLSQ
jgi:hypothetical protein